MGWDLKSVVPAEVEFAAAQELLRKHGDDARFDKPLKSWFTIADRNLFRWDASQSLRALLSSTFADVAAKSANDGMSIVILVSAIKRACRELARPTPVPKAVLATKPESLLSEDDGHDGGQESTESSEKKPLPEDVTAAVEAVAEVLPSLDCIPAGLWAAWCRNINASRLDRFPLGFYARSLRSLPARFWEVRISTYTRRSLPDIGAIEGHGESAVLAIVRIIGDLARILDRLPEEAPFRVLVMPSAILDLTTWMSQVLQRGTVPDVRGIAHGFVRPLLRQLDIDLGPQICEMVERRIGLDGRPQTLDDIAHDFRLTRERVRQLTKRAIGVLRIRWAEGRYLLDDFYDLLRGAHHAQEQVDLIRRVVDLLFDFEYVKAVSHTEIHEAWEKLGKQKRTPMTEGEIQSWLASEFFLVSPDIALAWIKDHALAASGSDRGTLYFTTAPQDRLLRELQTSGAPMTLADATEIVGDDERNVRLQLERDPRFVEDEYKRILAAESCSFVRRDSIWHVRVCQNDVGGRPESRSVSLENLAQLICTGLLELDVSDATVWGVLRYANKIFGQLGYGALPPEVSPFILASKLVAHSNGMIRVMRRRRLRWDGGDCMPPARGKLGWIGYAIGKAATPMTLRELHDALRTYYQDYEWYVLSQLSLDDEEDGENSCGARVVPGYTKYFPAIIVPYDWHLNVAQENISEEIKLLVAKIIAAGTRRKYPKKVLEDLPWLVELVDRHSFGKMQWSDEQPPRDDAENGVTIEDDPLEEMMPQRTDGGMIPTNGQVKAAERIETLLSRLF